MTMQDQHFSRDWTERHAQFSADIDSGLGQLSKAIGHRRESRQDIGGSYGFLDKYGPAEPAAPVLSPAASASLRGLAASVITPVLIRIATGNPLSAAAWLRYIEGKYLEA